MVPGNLEKKIIGEFFKQKRIQAGLTQGEMAKKLGWTNAQFISNWERGKCLPPKPILLDLIKICKIPKREVVDTHTYAAKVCLEAYLKISASAAKITG